MRETRLPSVLAGRYRVESELGSGGMASVWLATDEVLDRPVALKVLHAHLATDPGFVERFHREAVAAARLSHAAIVNVYDTGEQDGTSYIVMEHFEGSTLAEVLERDRALEPDRAVEMILQVLAALRAAHEGGVIHRDVKPGNVLIGPDGRVKVTDFGIAKAAYLDGADPTTTGSMLGSVPYLSPEQVAGLEVDHRTDLYATGVMLYEALTGRRPFVGETDIATAMQRLSADPVPPRALRPGISRPLEAAVMRALARKPEDRFPSAEAMAAVLGRLRRPDRTEPIPVIRDAAPPAVEGTDRSFFRSWLLVPLLVVLSVAALIGIGLAVGLLETGGPIGIQPADDAPDSPAQAEAYAPAEVMSFDPEGDGEENPDLVVLAHDGHVDTWWETQSYDLNPPGRTGLRVASQGIDKSGVGLLVDLGATHEVVGFVLRSPFPGWTFELRVGDDADVLATTTGPPFTSRSNQRVLLDEPIEGRFVLLWATSVVSAGNDHLATVAELQVLGPGG